MQVPILNGVYTDNGPDIRTSYPVNLTPTPGANGISNGYLRPAEGIVEWGVGPGVDRGGVNWNGACYRVMGTSLVRVDSNGAITVIGDVGGSGYVTMDYSFDRLAIASGGRLYYYDGSTLTQVTDPDLGNVVDVVWVDGYFMTTDGESLVVTELTDPTQVNPLKYGSSEADPDPILALLKLRNEVYVLNRYTIEVFDNVGGDFFPFQRVEGAQIQRGVVGTHACCEYMDSIAFMGGGHNEPVSIYLGANGTSTQIATQEISRILEGYTESELSQCKLESRTDKNHWFLYVHLPDRTLVYDANASRVVNQPVWHVLTSSLVGFARYRAQNHVRAYDKWIVGDPNSNKIGFLDDSVGSHWGDDVRWEFGTVIFYNEGRGALFHQLELVSLTGRMALGVTPRITTSYSLDGITWSQPKSIEVGTVGQLAKRLVWFQQGFMRHWRIQRFQGDSSSHLSFVRLEARLEPLAY
jgi:hypothetical protein